MSKDKLKKLELYIEGMHCPACEILIEKELLKIDGVEYVDVSMGTRNAILYMQSSTTINFKKISNKLKKLDYKLLRDRADQDTKPQIFKSLSVAVLLLVVFIVFEKFQLAKFVNFDSNLSFVSAFVLGLVASVSSCAALIGGVLLSLSKHWHSNVVSKHVGFHISRIIAFFILGGLLGSVGSLFKFDGLFFASILVILVSLLMLLIALQMLDFEFAQKLRLGIPKSWGAKIAEKSESGSSAYLVGALTFFLPCGFTLIAQGAALASGSFGEGAGIMLAFAYGTLPALVVLSLTSVQFRKKPHFSVLFNQVVGFILVFFALYNINSQMNVLGLPSLSDINLSKEVSQDIDFSSSYDQSTEYQIIKLVSEGFDYFLVGENTFQAGVPTKLVVDNKGVYGCAAALSVFGLTDNFTILEPGENVIDLGAPKSGNYKITCSMGMVQPVTVKFKS
jgi:sulfite exporter TauE/SafE/copper chaperone CopZ